MRLYTDGSEVVPQRVQGDVLSEVVFDFMLPNESGEFRSQGSRRLVVDCVADNKPV